MSPVLPSTVPVNFVTYDGIQQDNFEFHLADLDVMVFLHIQKTGGTTFGKHLVQDIDLDKPCVCRKPKHRPKSRQYLSDSSPRKNHKRVKRKLKCDCFRPGNDLGRSWLFSRYSTGWKCGLHPGWTELTACVDHYLDSQEGHLDNRRYFYVSFLREPVSRYLSEFKHVQRGATWKTSLHLCNGRPPTAEELPKCYQEEDWLGVRLPEFMSCESNLAANRQTRMLADLRLVNCYNTTGMSLEEREAIMLQSAKDNLQKLSFYGLTELQEESQYIFQDTFNLKFNVRFVQFDHNHADNAHDRLDEETLEKIRRINHLDVKLYEYARQLIVKRFEELKANDPDFEEHYEMMGEKPDRKKMLQTLDIEDQIDDDDEYK